jgi:hypothetical protein
MYFKGIRQDGDDWIKLAENRDKYQAVVNTEMNIRAARNGGNLSSC